MQEPEPPPPVDKLPGETPEQAQLRKQLEALTGYVRALSASRASDSHSRRESKYEFQQYVRRLEEFDRKVDGLVRVVLTGNGQLSLVTRFELIEGRLRALEKQGEEERLDRKQELATLDDWRRNSGLQIKIALIGGLFGVVAAALGLAPTLVSGG